MNGEQEDSLVMKLTALRAAVLLTPDKVGLNTIEELIEEVRGIRKHGDVNLFGNIQAGFRIDIIPQEFMEPGTAILMMHPSNMPDEAVIKIKE